MSKEKKLSTLQKLFYIQQELKAPKTGYNKFGKYNFRSLGDIQKALKPLCLKYRCTVLPLDSVILHIGDRHYYQAKIRFVCIDNAEDFIDCSELVQEAEAKKGMDKAQITGSCSSYAHKYAYTKLLMIDDTKDQDTNEFHQEVENTPWLAYDYIPLLKLIEEVTGDPASDYFAFMDSRWKINLWTQEDADRFIAKVKSGDITEPFH